jgi:hypothetical protein
MLTQAIVLAWREPGSYIRDDNSPGLKLWKERAAYRLVRECLVVAPRVIVGEQSGADVISV